MHVKTEECLEKEILRLENKRKYTSYGGTKQRVYPIYSVTKNFVDGGYICNLTLEAIVTSQARAFLFAEEVRAKMLKECTDDIDKEKAVTELDMYQYIKDILDDKECQFTIYDDGDIQLQVVIQVVETNTFIKED